MNIQNNSIKEYFPRRKFLKSSTAGIFTYLTAKAYCSEERLPVKDKNSKVKHLYLTRDQKNIHNRWNKDISPVLHMNSGDTVTIETRDASDGHFTPESTVQDIATRDSSKVHPITGPIYIEEAEPGDVLQIDILKYELGEWGWTLTGKGLGILPDELSKSYLNIWIYDKIKNMHNSKIVL